jgi:hypothetical protein
VTTLATNAFGSIRVSGILSDILECSFKDGNLSLASECNLSEQLHQGALSKVSVIVFLNININEG